LYVVDILIICRAHEHMVARSRVRQIVTIRAPCARLSNARARAHTHTQTNDQQRVVVSHCLRVVIRDGGCARARVNIRLKAQHCTLSLSESDREKRSELRSQILILLFSQTTKIIKNYGELKYKYKSDHLRRLIVYIYSFIIYI